MTEFRIAFTGDITLTKYFRDIDSLDRILDQDIARFLSDADHCVGNIEGPVCRFPDQSTKEFAHHTESKYAGELAKLGIDIWNLANNHVLDFGSSGVSETVQNAGQYNCRTIGAGTTKEEAKRPVIFDSAGGVGLFAVTYAEKNMKQKQGCAFFDWDDSEEIQRIITEIKSSCRWCIMVIHGGDEFSDMPMPYTRNRYKKYLDMGADIIVAHHPHVVQNYEQIGDKLIFYSLGNFIFDTDYQRSQKHTETGELLKLCLHEDRFTWEHMAVRIIRENQTLIKCEDPEIFTNLQSEDYKRIWPFAARALILANRKKSRYLNKAKFQNYNALLWTAREVYRCKDPLDRCRMKGKVKSRFIGVPQDKKALVHYLRDS